MCKQNRGETIDPRRPGLFHITVKVVRGLHLLGDERLSGNNYDYRRAIVKERIRKMAANFGIAVVFVAILGNHLHLVLANLPQVVDSWTDEEVMRRACRIYSWKFERLGVKDETPDQAQLDRFVNDRPLVAEMRLRKSDPSWFMKQLMQSLAHQFNKADGKKGHFVADRFHHRVITDDRSLLICGLYIDLNQIAAMEADRPELSMHTSAGMRIASQLMHESGRLEEAGSMDGFLAPISVDGDGRRLAASESVETRRALDTGFFEFSLSDYLKMLDEMGRQERLGKRGKIPSELSPILERLELDGELLLDLIENYDSLFRQVVGIGASLTDFVAAHGGIGQHESQNTAAFEDAYAKRVPKKRKD